MMTKEDPSEGNKQAEHSDDENGSQSAGAPSWGSAAAIRMKSRRPSDPSDLTSVVSRLTSSWNVAGGNLDELADSGELYLPGKPDDIAGSEWLRLLAVASTYSQRPNEIRDLIREDPAARDVVAVSRRREQTVKFRRLLTDASYFDEQTSELGGPERVWQFFLEENQWILGGSLSVQFLAAWDQDRLEQTIAGSSVAGPGKRSDALLRTVGRVRSLAFVEIKHHRTALLGDEYRSGCWAPSKELSGGVAQVQGTVQRAVAAIGHRLQEQDPDGSDIPGEFSYLFRPRSYLIIGSLDELYGEAGGLHVGKFQSFELYRRHMDEPEIITFDELLARTEGLLDMPDV